MCVCVCVESFGLNSCDVIVRSLVTITYSSGQIGMVVLDDPSLRDSLSGIIVPDSSPEVWYHLRI